METAFAPLEYAWIVHSNHESRRNRSWSGGLISDFWDTAWLITRYLDEDDPVVASVTPEAPPLDELDPPHATSSDVLLYFSTDMYVR